jgi:hypothetical protein
VRIRLFTIYSVYGACLLLSSSVHASESIAAVKLTYQELEQGIEPYVLTYTVSSDYVKIEDEADTSGYILYDIKANSIYSVNHYDQAILVIPEYPVTDFKPEFNVDIEYEIFKDAPAIAGKQVHSYKVRAITDKTDDTCMKIQLVPGLLPDVANSLQGFQRLMSGQQAITLEQTPEEYRTPCYLVDQIYNKGEYYSKGLPIHEWHSNERMRQLLNYEEVKVDVSIFDIPDEYRQYSLK